MSYLPFIGVAFFLIAGVLYRLRQKI
ncbi:hypothetical protein HN020_07580 [Brevibacillus borstelensis]|nr:hypothetical protein [Brevibacillus borstelensis]